jgi:SSS family solute:Na+ symporter
MQLGALDIGVFVAFFGVVVGVSMYKSRREKTGEDYFLASRSLLWPFIGLSLIAANISTEHFVGMAGQGAGVAGMAIASYEWMAAITLVFVAIFFLPRFLRSGIFTIPEYLEYRYNPAARAIMAFYTMVIYIGVTISAVIYSGGLTLQTIFGDLGNHQHLLYGIWVIGGIAALYTIWGGLKAVAWADLFQGSALIIGGAITMVLGFKAIGVNNFFETNADKLHMILPKGHSVLPWTALVIGLWIPNFYYWGLNQYITQRTLAAKSLKQGQLGIIFAAGLKLIIPFVIIFRFEADYTVRHYLSGDNVAAALPQPDDRGKRNRCGLSATNQKPRESGNQGVYIRGDKRGSDKFLGLDAELGIDNIYDGPVQTALQK